MHFILWFGHMKLLQHEFKGYVQYGLADIIEKYHFGVSDIFDILFEKYFELRKSTMQYIRLS